jgi:hypothetical protein
MLLCVNVLFVYVVLAELHNEKLRNAQIQGAIRQAIQFNYDYMSRNNINWDDYIDRLKEGTDNSRLIDKYYIPYCEKIETGK